MTIDLEQAREHVWQALAASPIRRAVLGRERCDAIVRVAVNAMPDETQLAWSSVDDERRGGLCRALERRVRANYSEACGFAFATMILAWAISAIVQALVARWIENHWGPQR